MRKRIHLLQIPSVGEHGWVIRRRPDRHPLCATCSRRKPTVQRYRQSSWYITGLNHHFDHLWSFVKGLVISARRHNLLSQLIAQPFLAHCLRASCSATREISKKDEVPHWYDFLRPFCHVGQSRTAILIRQGLNVAELPIQAHTGIRLAGFQWDLALAEVQRREAKEAGLALNWPSRLPNTRLPAGSFRVGASASA